MHYRRRLPSSHRFQVLDISWISNYADEREYLLLDHTIEIETCILTSDFYWANIPQYIGQREEDGNHTSYKKRKEPSKRLSQSTEISSRSMTILSIKSNHVGI
eukprot:1108452_1